MNNNGNQFQQPMDQPPMDQQFYYQPTDGMPYYPEPAPPPPQPPQKSSHGCLIAVIAAVGGFLILCFLFMGCALIAGIASSTSERASRRESMASSVSESSYAAESSLSEEAQLSAEDEQKSSETSSEEGATSGAGDSSELSSAESSEEMIDGMRKSFVESMDSYEAFFDEYVEFMTLYTNSPSSSEMLLQYLDFMQKYAEYMDKFEKVGYEDLNEKEMSYYLEVQSRITQKLLSVTSSIAAESSEESV